MAKIVLFTQYMENYAWREDGSLGTGADAYWKFKGGSEYVVKNVDINRAQEIAQKATEQINVDNDAFREYVISWEVVQDDYLTDFEQSQLEYEGKITYPARGLEVVL